MGKLQTYALKYGSIVCEPLPKPFNFVCKFSYGLLADMLKPKEREIFELTESETELGHAFRLSLYYGNFKQECYIIQDKYTNKWKDFGPRAVCQIARRILKTGDSQSALLEGA